MSADQPTKPGRAATGRAGDLAARLAALPGTQPDPRPSPRRSSGRRPAASRDAGKRRPAPPPPEQGRPAAFYSERLSITTTAEQVRALRAARLTDGIQATARLRAMIAAWQDDPELRERIDRAAQDWTG